MGKEIHLAGIVPVVKRLSDFKMPWDDCLMPIATDYVAVERAVAEAAYAGCETIWVVCRDDIAPLIKHRLGEYAGVPSRMKTKNYFQRGHKVPIFYIPLNIHDQPRRSCATWGILWGANVAYRICEYISQWVTPSRYYVAFPQGVYPPEEAGKYLRAIADSPSFFFADPSGRTVRDGEFLGFTFTEAEFIAYRRKFRKVHAEEYKIAKNKIPSLGLDKIFGYGNIERVEKPVPWYYPIDCWDNYCKFLGSDERSLVEKPSNKIITGKVWKHKIGTEDE